MWTLENMRKFVLTHHAEVPCPSCKGSRSAGVIIFKPVIKMTGQFNDKTMEEEVVVTVDVWYEKQTCFCNSYTEHEAQWISEQARKEIWEDFSKFLHFEAPPGPVEKVIVQ